MLLTTEKCFFYGAGFGIFGGHRILCAMQHVMGCISSFENPLAVHGQSHPGY